MHRAIRSLALALALLVLASGAVHARPLATRPSPTGYFGTLWQWVASLLPAWTKEGGTMDPDGNRHHLPAPLPTSDSGGAMDPDGYTNKSGGTMDPNGSPPSLSAPLPRADAGGMMDPDG